MSADRFWEITCDFRDAAGRECHAAAPGATGSLRETRKMAASHGWVRGPHDSDYCPRHAAGAVMTRTHDAASQATRALPGIGYSPDILPQRDATRDRATGQATKAGER